MTLELDRLDHLGSNAFEGFVGEFSRGKDSIRAEGGIVLVGNLSMDLDQAQRIGHLLAPLPPDMRDDTAFMDRLHAYAPGWEFPKLDPRRDLTDHFGLVSDFLSECFTRLRTTSRAGVMDGRIHFGGALSGRDIEAVRKTVSGLVKLLFPSPSVPVAVAPRARGVGKFDESSQEPGIIESAQQVLVLGGQPRRERSKLSAQARQRFELVRRQPDPLLGDHY
jgi:hypothetical protein